MGNELIALMVFSAMLASAYLAGHTILPPLLAIAALVILIVVRESHERSRLDFVNQLKSCRKELRAGGTVVVDNLLLRYDSVVTTYHLNVGLLITSINISSKYRSYTGEDHAESIVYSLCSLVTGWWSFPSGPITTFHYIKENLFGGQKAWVAQLIDEPIFRPEPKPLQIYAPDNDNDLEPESTKQINTGEKSHSQKGISQRTSTAKSPSYSEHVISYQDPSYGSRIKAERYRNKLRAFVKNQEDKYRVLFDNAKKRISDRIRQRLNNRRQK